MSATAGKEAPDADDAESRARDGGPLVLAGIPAHPGRPSCPVGSAPNSGQPEGRRRAGCCSRATARPGPPRSRSGPCCPRTTPGPLKGIARANPGQGWPMSGVDPPGRLERLAMTVLQPGFGAPRRPTGCAGRSPKGSAGSCCSRRNIAAAEQLAALTARLRAENPAAVVAIDEEGGRSPGWRRHRQLLPGQPRARRGRRRGADRAGGPRDRPDARRGRRHARLRARRPTSTPTRPTR